MIPLLLLTGWLTALPSALMGKAEYAKKEKKPCTSCHVKAGTKELNNVGQCYKSHDHSLEGCEAGKAAEKKG